MITVPRRPPLLVPDGSLIADPGNDLRNAAPVVGAAWHDMALAYNWMAGHGRQLVCGLSGHTGHDDTTVSPFVLRSYFVPDEHLPAPPGRLWLVTLLSSSNYKPFEIEFYPSGVTYQARTGPSNRTSSFLWEETILSDTYTNEPEFGYDISWSGGGSIYHVNSSCCDIPLARLPTGYGIEDSTMHRGDPIFADSASLRSVFGVLQGYGTGMGRTAMFSYWNDDGITTTNTTFAGSSNVFVLNPAIQARRRGSSSTLEDVRWTACVSAQPNGGAAAEIRLTTAAGSVTQSFSNETRAWIVGSSAITVETDDPSRYDTDGGIRGGTRDSVIVELRRTTASSATIYGLVLGEG